jgi:hypothetical protein
VLVPFERFDIVFGILNLFCHGGLFQIKLDMRIYGRPTGAGG